MRLRTTLFVPLLLLALSGASALAEPEEKSVSFKIRVCETDGDSAMPLLHADAEKAWPKCDKPVADVPVKLSSGSESSELIQTSSEGVASVGPVSVAKGGKVRVMVACTTHNCLNFSFDERGVREGENLLVWLTKPLPPAEESAAKKREDS